MKVVALIYCEDHLTDGDLHFRGEFLPHALKERISAVEGVDDFYTAVPASYAGKLSGGERLFALSNGDDINFWKMIFEKTAADHVIKLHADSPFMDASIVREMLKVHQHYLAEYTYSENLPAGITAEILSRKLLESVPSKSETKASLGEIIRSNINRFDVELYYHEPDLRDKRISFRSGNPRDRKIMENIVASKGRTPAYAELKEIIHDHPETLYIGPSFVEVELSGHCDLDCLFCYRTALKKRRGDMDDSLFSKLLSDLGEFNLPYAICLGGSGEPAMHPRFYRIMESALAQKNCSNLIIETNGIHLDGNFINFAQNANDRKIKIIVNLNGVDAGSYRTIHRGDYFDSVTQNVLALREAFPDKERLYVQVMKINETEPFLDRYYDFWEQHGVPVILQKQNTYLGRVPDRRYSDLSPLDRGPCWHLQRDVFILSDGRVAYCKQDIDGDFCHGNIGERSLIDICNSALPAFTRDYHGDFPPQPDCGACDEWYTFNL